MRRSDKEARFLELDGVRLEVASGDLTGSDGRTIRLAPQPTSLLTLLAEKPGRVVTRDEIAEHLWPHGSVEVDQGIGYAVREVRKGIESVGGDPTIIETIPRRGFRVRFDASSAGDAGAPATRPTWSRLAIGGAIGCAALAAVFLTRSQPEVPVLAIFAHESSGDAVTRELGSVLGSTLTTRITRDYAGRVAVVGPTGTAALAGPGDTDGAQELLGACLILSGSVRDSNDSTVVVFTQLVRSADRVHVWASTDTVPQARAVESVVPGILGGMESALSGCVS